MHSSSAPTKLVWYDIENTPHVWVLLPLARELERRGVRTLWTAKDSGYIRSLCARLGIRPKYVGPSRSHASTAGKIAAVILRAIALATFVLVSRSRPSLAVSHGSRSASLAAYLLRIPSVTLDDYEHSYQGFARFSSRVLVPDVIPPTAWAKAAGKVKGYPGFKEMIYLADNALSNSPEFLTPEDKNKIIVLFRPDSPIAHYRKDSSPLLRRKILGHLAANRDVLLVAFPRTLSQGKEIADFCRRHNVDCRIPTEAVDGPALIAQADLVIGGGGTMTREAAVLGIPSYTFFSAKEGAVDVELERQGLLVMLRSDSDIGKILLKKRDTSIRRVSPDTRDFVTASILELLNGGKSQ